MKNNKEYKTKRIGGYLYRIIPIIGKTGKVISHAVTPFMVEFKPRDLLQVIVGASILAVPLAFTAETWELGEQLPLINAIIIALMSIIFVGGFVYFNFYRFNFRQHMTEYFKRVFAIYFFSLLVVGILLTLIEKCPWGIDNITAIKRIIIVAFPASMSASLSDALK